MKRPSLQFYVGEWQLNANLKRCTHAEKGIWLDIMCLAHDADEYGVIRWPLKDIAVAVGCKVSDLEALREKGVLKGADASETCASFIYTPRHAGQDGAPVELIAAQQGPIWYFSRMVKDDYVAKSRGKSSRFGGGSNNSPPSPIPSPTRGVGDGSNVGSQTPTARDGDGPSCFDLLSSSSEDKSSSDPTLAPKGAVGAVSSKRVRRAKRAIYRPIPRNS
jgi:hypothetical protein